MYRATVAIVCLLLVTGCSFIPWLSGEVDARPPTELESITPVVEVHTLWSRQVGEGTDGRRLSLVPAIQGGRLYVADARGRVVALNASDGQVVWERETGLALSGGPDVDGKTIVLGSSDGDLVALSARDGKPLWNARLDSEILSVPRILGSTVVVHTLDDSVYAFDIAAGKQLWKYGYPVPVLTLRGSSTPAISGDNIIVGISGGKLVNLEMESGLPRWETTVTAPRGRSELARIADLDADPIIVEGMIYAATYNGDLAAVDLTSGSVLWRRQLSASSGLSADSGSLYVTDSDDVVWAATTQDGSGTWKQEAFKYRRLSAPAVVGNSIAVGDFEGYVHWLDRRDGRIIARLQVADGRIAARPQVVGGKLYVYGDDGTIAALSAGSPPPTRRSSQSSDAAGASAPDP